MTQSKCGVRGCLQRARGYSPLLIRRLKTFFGGYIGGFSTLVATIQKTEPLPKNPRYHPSPKNIEIAALHFKHFCKRQASSMVKSSVLHFLLLNYTILISSEIAGNAYFALPETRFQGGQPDYTKMGKADITRVLR